jgi:hypothetical protein
VNTSSAKIDLDTFLTNNFFSLSDHTNEDFEEVIMRPEDLLLVGYTDVELNTGRLSTRLARGMDSDHATATFHSLLPTEWSTPFGLDSAGTTGEVEIQEETSSSNHKAAYTLGVSIDVALPPFERTKVISVAPRFVIVNMVGRSILVKQEGALGDRYVAGPGGRSDALLVKASQRVPFHWADVTSRDSCRTMSVRFDEYGWEWSCDFPIQNVGEFSVRLRNGHTHARHLARVEVCLVDSTLFIVFQAEQRRLPPYRIENLSFETLHYHQENVNHIEEVLLPYQTDRYTWDDLVIGGLNSVKRLVITAVGTDNQPHSPIVLGAFSLDKIAEHGTVGNGELPLRISVVANGPTKIIRIVDTRIRVAGGVGRDHGGGGDRDRRSIVKHVRRKSWTTYLIPFWWLSNNNGNSNSNNSGNSMINNGAGHGVGSGSDITISARDAAVERLRVQLSRAWWSTSLSSHFLPKASTSASTTMSCRDIQISLDIRGIGISVVDATPRELIYCAVSSLRMGIELTNEETAAAGGAADSNDSDGNISTRALQIGMQIGSVQIDNQLHTTLYPVLLHTDRNATQGALSLPSALVPNVGASALPEGPQAHVGEMGEEKGVEEALLSTNKDVTSPFRSPPSMRYHRYNSEDEIESNSNSESDSYNENSGEEEEENYWDEDMEDNDALSWEEEDEDIVDTNDNDNVSKKRVNELEMEEKRYLKRMKKRKGIKNRRKTSRRTTSTSSTHGDKNFVGSGGVGRPVFEVALYSNSGGEQENNGTTPTTTTSGSSLVGGAGTFTNVRYFSVLVLPLHVNVDGNLVTAILQMSSRLTNHQKDGENITRKNGGEDHRIGDEVVRIVVPGRVLGNDHSKLREVLAHRQNGQKVYFEEVEIHPLRITVSFVADGASGRRSSTIAPNSSSSSSSAPLNSILRSMGARLTMIVNAPLQLNGVALSDAYVTVGTLSDRIITRYRGDAMRQAYLLLGSSELLGNPVGLLQNLGTGVRDFFYEPAQGLVRYSPLQFGTGLARGTLSLAMHSTTGVAMWCSKLAGNARWAIDRVYTRYVESFMFSSHNTTQSSNSRRNNRSRDDAQALMLESAGAGAGGIANVSNVSSTSILSMPASSIIRNVWGFTVFVVHPVAVPLLLMRQTLSMVEAVGPAIARLTETEVSVALSLQDKTKMRRVRPPRFFTRSGPHHVLRMYNIGTSAGEEVLARVSNAKFWGEGYVWHVMLSESSSDSKSTTVDDWVLLATSHRIILVWRFEMVWQIPWKDLLCDTVMLLTEKQAIYAAQNDESVVSSSSGGHSTSSQNNKKDMDGPFESKKNNSDRHRFNNTKYQYCSGEDEDDNNNVEDCTMIVKLMHMPRTRYGEVGGQYFDDYRGGGGYGGSSSTRQVSKMLTSTMDSIASTMSFMKRQIKCGSRVCGKRVVRLLKRGVHGNQDSGSSSNNCRRRSNNESNRMFTLSSVKKTKRNRVISSKKRNERKEDGKVTVGVEQKEGKDCDDYDEKKEGKRQSDAFGKELYPSTPTREESKDSGRLPTLSDSPGRTLFLSPAKPG